MIRFSQKGDFKHTEKFLKGVKRMDFAKILAPYGIQGVQALSRATPSRTGGAAAAWDYEISVSKTSVAIAWTNAKMAGSVPLVILIQYGHGTRNGGYVQGQDFINPSLRPLFDKIRDDVWREVTSL